MVREIFYLIFLQDCQCSRQGSDILPVSEAGQVAERG